jgi:hypothetical protein
MSPNRSIGRVQGASGIERDLVIGIVLREVLPHVSSVGNLWNAANRYSALVFKQTRSAAQILRIQLQSIEVRSPSNFDSALPAPTQQRVAL